MTYIILRDTFGRGLETISNIGVDVIEEHQLDEYICAAADIILAEDGWDGVDAYDEDNVPMGETLVICEILGELKGKNVDTYIQDVLKNKEEQKDAEEYQLFLKLKEKFEK
jgi:threonine dehydratase